MKPSDNLMNAIARYQAGDQNAFEIIYNESLGYVTQSVLNVLRKTVGNPSDSLQQDIIQETYLTIAINLSYLRNPEAFLQWAGRIATHQAERTWQRDAAHAPVELDPEDLAQEPASDDFIPEDILENQETLRIIRQLLQELPVNQYLCIVEYYYNGLKETEVAQKLGMPVNTVKTNLSRAKKKLRVVIEDTEKKENIRLHSMAWLLLVLYHGEIRDLVVSEAERLALWNRLQPRLPASTAASGVTGASAVGAKAVGSGILGGMAVKIGAVAVAAAVAVGGLCAVGQKLLHNDPPAVSVTEPTAPADPTEATEEVTTPPTEPAAAIHLSAEELDQLAAAIDCLAVGNREETYTHWVNEASQQTYDVMYGTLSNAAMGHIHIPLNVTNWQGDCSFSVADAATFLDGVFGHVPNDLSTYCDDLFYSNDGTTMVHMFLPSDVTTFASILTVEQIDSENIRIFAAEFYDYSSGDKVFSHYYAVSAHRNPDSYMGWTFSEAFCFKDPAYLPAYDDSDLSQGLDCVPDSGFSEETFHTVVDNGESSGGYLTEAEAARRAEEYWNVEPGEYYGEDRRSEESVIYVYSEDVDENNIPYYEFRWCYEDGGFVHTVDFVKISKIDGKVLTPYEEFEEEPVEDVTLPSIPEETQSQSTQHSGKTVTVSRISKKTEYDYNGSVLSTIEFTYNQNGQILESFTRDADGHISARSKYVYDAQGRLIRKVDVTEYSTCWMEYTYDPDSGLLVKEQRCDENGNLRNEKTTYKYTNAGKLLSKCEYDSDGKIYASYDYSYDDQGNMTYCDYYYGNNFRSETCVYDKQNRLITKTLRRHSDEIIIRDPGTVISTTQYIYLRDGRLDTEATYDEDGTLREFCRWTYNKNGSSCEIDGMDGTGTTTYDQHGNMLTHVFYEGIIGVELEYSYVYTTMRVPAAFAD